MDSNDSDYTVAMYADALEAWITALESGEYPQTTGMMCRPTFWATDCVETERIG